MKFSETYTHQSDVIFLMDTRIEFPLFRQLLDKLAASFCGTVEWISMPEAEIGKIQIGAIRIYGKLDFDYGAEFQCSGLSTSELHKIRTVLTAFLDCE